MIFTTKKFDLDVIHLNYYLGLKHDTDVESIIAKSKNNYINWKVDFEERDWGIKSIIPSSIKCSIHVAWEIELSELNHDEIFNLNKRHDGEIHGDYISGTIDVSEFRLIDRFEYTDGQLKIESVHVDFMDEEIEIF